MAHEITEHDGAVFHRKPAWHGLGVVVDDAPTPVEALKLANLDWLVEKTPIYTVIDKGGETVRVPVDTHEAIRRVDTDDIFNIVSKRYAPVQNQVLAEFAEALAEQGDAVHIESAGSTRGGRKVWLLLKGESFSVRKDEVMPYILLANAHDSSMSLRGVPTTIRVQCANTLHMVLPEGRGENANSSYALAGFSFHHTTNILNRVEEAKQMLKLYGHSLDTTKALVNTLARKNVTRAQIQDFWLDCYQHDFQAIPEQPVTRAESRKREKAMESMVTMAKIFDRDRDAAGTSAWNMANAYTEWLQHHRVSRNKEGRCESNIFGEVAKQTIHTMVNAYHLASA